MKFFVACLFLVIAAVNEASAHTRDHHLKPLPCPDDSDAKGKVISVYIEGCDGVHKCVVPIEVVKNVTFTFVPDVDAEEAYVYGTFDLMTDDRPINVHAPDNRACPFIDPTCPLTGGKTYTYKNVFNVMRDFSGGFTGDTTLQFRLGYKNFEVCFRVAVHMTDDA